MQSHRACKTFSGAISKTGTHGEINCFDPGAFDCINGIVISTNVKATVYDWDASGNTLAGIYTEDLDGGGPAELAVDHCVVTDNGTGFQSVSNSTIRVSNTTAMYNTALSSGTVLSYANNQAARAAFSGPVPPS